MKPAGEKYRPNIPSKYITEDSLEYINTAIPSKYMILEGEPECEPKCNNTHQYEDKYNYQ